MSIQKVKRKNGFAYKVVIQFKNRQQISRTFERKVDAQQWEIEELASRSGASTYSQSAAMTVATLCDYWLTNHSKPKKSIAAAIRDEAINRNYIKPAFGSQKLHDVSVREVEVWINKLSLKGLAPKTCNSILGTFKKIYNDAVTWQFIRSNPLNGVRALRLAQTDFSFLQQQDAPQFFEQANAIGKSWYSLCVVAVNTGLRKGELRALTWDCVDFSSGKITVKQSYCEKSDKLKSTKSNLVRWVPMNSHVIAALIETKATAISNQVFERGISWSKVHEITAKTCELANINKLRFHDLRHSFASNLVMNGVSIYDVKTLMGHSSVKQTERYSHLAPNHLLGKTDSLFPAMHPTPSGNVVSLFA